MEPDNDARINRLEDETRRLEKVLQDERQNNKLLKLAIIIRRGLLMIAKGIETIFGIGKPNPDSKPHNDDST